MPNMDGMTAFQELVRSRPTVKVILSVEIQRAGFHPASVRRGLAGFLQKPYSLQNLRDALEKAGKTEE
jgi:DNA-binding NtrC family response regulator